MKKNIIKTIVNHALIGLSVILIGFIGSIVLELYVKKTIGDNLNTNFHIGQQFRLDDYELNFDKMTVGEYRWDIENEKIIEIDDEYISAVGIGSTKVDVYDGLGSLVKSFTINVDFAVADVEMAIRESLGIEKYDELYKEQFLQVQEVDFRGIDFSTLSDLYLLENVKELYLSGTSITGVSNGYVSETVLDLSRFTKLENIDLSSTLVSDISPFYEKDGIVKLNLANTKITNVEYKLLAESIEVLDISGTLIDKIETFDDLGLTELYANNLNLKRISLDGEHESLKVLSLNDVTATSIELCGELSNLTELSFNNISVSGAITISNEIENLKKLSIANSKVGSLNLTADMVSLTDIDTNGSTINTIKFDAMFPNYKSVSIEDCSVNTVIFSPACILPELNKLTISGTGATDIQISASNMGKLSSIDFSKNNLTNFEMNISSEYISILDLSYNNLTKIELNKDYENLTTLNLTGNEQLSIYLDGNFNKLSNIVLGESNVSDMTLEGSFNSLTSIKSNGAILQSLNLVTDSSFPVLKEINLDSAQITNLKLGSTIEGLETLILSNNAFNELKLSASYSKLKTIVLDNVTLTESVALTGDLSKLISVSAKNMKCKNFNATGNLSMLDELLLSGIEANSLVIGGNNVSVSRLDLSNILVANVNVNGLNNLQTINFANARIDNITFDNSYNELSELDFSPANNIKRIDFLATASLPNLVSLNASENETNIINLNCDMPKLSLYNISSNKLESLNLNKNLESLTTLIIANNPFVNVDINNDYNKLQSIDMGNCKEIENCNISGNYAALTSFSINSANIRAVTFDCNFNEIITLNLSNGKINKLDFSENSSFNKLNTLNLSNLGLLTLEMDGEMIELKELNLGGNLFEKITLAKSFNKLNKLILSENTNLKNFNISADFSELTTLEVLNCSNIITLNIEGNINKLRELSLDGSSIGKIILAGELSSLETIIQKKGKIQYIEFGNNSATNIKNIDINGVGFVYENMAMPMPFTYYVPETKTSLLNYSLTSNSNFIMNLSAYDTIDFNERIKISPNAVRAGFYCNGAILTNVGFEFINGSENDLYIYSLELTAMNSSHAINATNVTKVNLYFTGLNKISAFPKASETPVSTILGNDVTISSAQNLIINSQNNCAEKKGAVNGVSAIQCTNLTLIGIMEISGGNGGSPTATHDYENGVTGGNGGNAVSVTQMLFFNKATVSLTGGNGGNGSNSLDTAGTGGNGGAGGMAFSTNKLKLNSSNVTCYGGDGGNGGTGGEGDAGDSGANGGKNDDGNPGDPGGTGGTGGQGGNCICIKLSTVEHINSQIVLNGGTSGNGGTGGTGGQGGNGGNGYDGLAWTDSSGGAGGKGGTGGKGGDAGSCSLDSLNETFVNGNPDLFKIDSKGATGKGGTGGQGGNGGNGGTGYENDQDGGARGEAGDGGAGGSPNGSKGGVGKPGLPGEDKS